MSDPLISAPLSSAPIMSAALARVSLVLAAVAALGACGGGGGGGGVSTGPGAVDVPFTAFSAIGQNQTVVLQGIAATAEGTDTRAQTADGVASTITSATLNPINAALSTARYTYQNGNLVAININTPHSNVAIDARTGDQVQCAGGICGAWSATAETFFADPAAAGWNYQTFGIWAARPGATSWQTGAISIGAPTPAAAVPTTGLATFTGAALGLFVNATGTPFSTSALMNAQVNFGGRSIAFSTTQTDLVNLNTGASTLNVTGLNLSGSFTYGAGVNQFTGPVNTSNGQLTGQAIGRFYGPNAEEIGGAYRLAPPGGGVSHMLGSFGGRRP